MKHVVNLLIIAVFFSEFNELALISGAFKAVTISPEFLSLAVLLCGLVYFGVVKKIVIAPKYLWLFMFMIVYLLCNVALNSVPAGAIIGGLRRYVKFLPLFFFPLVYEFSDEEILQKLKLILGLTIFQFPVAFAQRFILYSHLKTGDVVRGTLATSGVLSIYLNCVIAVVLAFYLYKKISFISLVILSIIIFFPMLINETKSTLLLLPIAIFIPVLFSRVEEGKIKKTILVTGLTTIMLAVFVVAYNHFWGAESRQRRLEVFFQEGATGYLYKELKPGTTDVEAGRIDSIAWAYHELSNDPMKLIFGLGMGNVGPSILSSFEGKYTKEYEGWAMDMTTITYLMWEIGFFGIMLLFLFFFFVLLDSLKLRKSDNIVVSALSTGWVAVVLVMIPSLLYKNLLTQNAIGFLFFLLSGYLVSKKVDFEKENYAFSELDNVYDYRSYDN